MPESVKKSPIGCAACSENGVKCRDGSEYRPAKIGHLDTCRSFISIYPEGFRGSLSDVLNRLSDEEASQEY